MSAKGVNWIDEVISEVLPHGLGGDVVLDDLPSVSTLTGRSLDLLRNAAGQSQGRLDDWLFGPHRTMQASMPDAMLLVGMGLMRRQTGRLSGQANFYITDAGRGVLAEAERPVGAAGQMTARQFHDRFVDPATLPYSDVLTWMTANGISPIALQSEDYWYEIFRDFSPGKAPPDSAVYAARRPIEEITEISPIISWAVFAFYFEQSYYDAFSDWLIKQKGIDLHHTDMSRKDWEALEDEYQRESGVIASQRRIEEGTYRERRARRLQSSIPTLHDRVKWVLSSTAKPGLTADLVGAALEMSTAEAAEILAALVQKGEVEELAAGVFRLKATVKRPRVVTHRKPVREAEQVNFATFVDQSPLSVQEADVFWDWLEFQKGIENINDTRSLEEWSDLLTEFGESEYGGGFYGARRPARAVTSLGTQKGA